jgi:hypothetical protein
MGIPGCRDHYSAIACDYSYSGFPKTNDKRIYYGIDKRINQIKEYTVYPTLAYQKTIE